MNRQAVMSLESPLAGRFVNDAPEPTNDVAVIIPTIKFGVPLNPVASPVKGPLNDVAVATPVTLTPEERRLQAISFAYGNLAIDRPETRYEDVANAYDNIHPLPNY